MGNNLSPLQERLLPLLAWFHRFCVENSLRYYALGGTMLGAARHQGFIPWDDDLDVGMPREDYEKFSELCRNRVFGDYAVETIDTEADDFFYGYTKVYDTKTTLVENTRYKIKRGIYIDVFPLDGAGDSKEEAQKIYKPIQRRINLLMSLICGFRRSRKWYKNAVIAAGRMIPNFVLNKKKFMLGTDKLCRARAYDTCEYIGNFYGNWGLREVMPKQILGTPKEYKFEHLTIFGAEDFDGYLTSLYRNWREMPPEEKRVTHHDYLLLDLDKSYLAK